MTVRVLAASAAISILAACGGGGGGSGSIGDGQGPVAPSFGAYARSNPTAQDLLDHWNDPRRLRAALGLSQVVDPGERRAAIAGLLDTVQRDPAGTGTLLRNIRAGDVTIVGEPARNRLRAMEGRAGGHAQHRVRLAVRPECRRRLARPYGARREIVVSRITDEFGTHTAPGGTSIVHDDVRETLAGEVTTNGVIVFVLDKVPCPTTSPRPVFGRFTIRPTIWSPGSARSC